MDEPTIEYTTLEEAMSDVSVIIPQDFMDVAIPIAWVILQEGVPSVQRLVDVRYLAPISAESKDLMSHSNLRNLDSDDHPQYLTETRHGAIMGNVHQLSSIDVGADALGTAQTTMTNHLNTEKHLEAGDGLFEDFGQLKVDPGDGIDTTGGPTKVKIENGLEFTGLGELKAKAGSAEIVVDVDGIKVGDTLSNKEITSPTINGGDPLTVDSTYLNGLTTSNHAQDTDSGTTEDTFTINLNGNKGILDATSLTVDQTLTLPDVTGVLSTDITDGGEATIKEPTDGDWTDGFFDSWEDTTKVKDALDEISEAFLDLAPAKGQTLTNSELVLTGTTTYQAKLSSGMSGIWYTGGHNPGDLINGYILDSTYLLNHQDNATYFRCGKKDDPTTYGVFSHKINGVVDHSYDMEVLGVGNDGNITITDISNYNTFWSKGNATVNYIHGSEGKLSHTFEHTEAGESNPMNLWLDNVNALPSFSVVPVLTERVPGGWTLLSGVEYYQLGATFDIEYTVSNLFNKCYHPTEATKVEFAGSEYLINPTSPPAFNAIFEIVQGAHVLTVTEIDLAINTTQSTVTAKRPNSADISSTSNILVKGINTYTSPASTNTSDIFVDEAWRTPSGGLSENWDSSIALVNGNAQVRNGVLQFPYTGEYPGFTGPQVYERFLHKATANSGSIQLDGITDIDPVGTGDINIELILVDEALTFD